LGFDPGDAVTLAIDGAAAHVFTADGTAQHPEPPTIPSRA